jgi:hypothetical protein
MNHPGRGTSAQAVAARGRQTTLSARSKTTETIAMMIAAQMAVHQNSSMYLDGVSGEKSEP